MLKPTENQKSKEGFTIISHELYEWAMASGLCKQELNVIHAIIRQTNGWNQRKEAPMSLRFIGGVTNTHHRNVDKTVKKLLNKKIIFRRAGEKMKYGKPVFIYRLNKHLCCLQNASQKNCRTIDASTGVNSTPEPAVSYTPNKDTKHIKNKEVKDKMEKLFSYKKHQDEKTTFSNENQKPDSKTENCGTRENTLFYTK